MNAITSMKNHIQCISVKTGLFWSKEVIFNTRLKMALKVFSYLYIFMALGCFIATIKYLEPHTAKIIFILICSISLIIYITLNYLTKTVFTWIVAAMIFILMLQGILALNGKHLPCVGCEPPASSSINNTNSNQIAHILEQVKNLEHTQTK